MKSVLDDDVNIDEADISNMLDLPKRKKKPKKKKEKSDNDDPCATVACNNKECFKDPYLDQRQLLLEESDALEKKFPDKYDRKADYTYSDLLNRVIDILHCKNPDLMEKKRRNMKPPQLTRVGTKKTLWVNFQEICTMMQRSPEHVFQFFMAELGTEGSIDGNQRLVIRGKYVPKYIESLLRKYIVEYVTCQMCRSPNTDLHKDSTTRLQFCNCKDCGSSRSVVAIRSGYHAISKADRRAARNAKV